MAGNKKTLVSRLEELRAQTENDRDSNWKEHWRELAEYILPRHERFLETDASHGTAGKKKHDKIIDGTATWAVRTLASGMMSGLTSPSRPWFRLGLPDPDLAEFAPVRSWLGTVEQRMRDTFSRSNIYNILPSGYEDLGCFGVTALGLFEHPTDIMRGFHFPIGAYSMSSDQDNRVDTMIRVFMMSARQMARKFDWDSLTPGVQSSIEKGQGEVMVKIVHAVTRNEFYLENGFSSKPFMSVYYELAKNQGRHLRIGGFHEFPIMAPRWSVTGEDVYGNSPCMDVLGDVKALQLYQKRSAQAIDKMVNPPLNAPGSMRNKKVSQLPGDVNYQDIATDRGGLRPVYELNFDVGAVELKIQQHQSRINRATFVDLFLALLNTDRREITAREVEEKREEKLLMLGPVLERLNDELLDPLIDRTYEIMRRRDLIPPPPEEIEGQDLKIEYVSILAQAQKLVGLASQERLLGFVANMMALNPEAGDKVDWDQNVDVYSNVLGTAPELILDDEAVADIREERAASIAKEQAMLQGQQAAETAHTLSKADISSQNALTALTGGPVPGAE